MSVHHLPERTRSTLTPADWIERATLVLTDQGIDAVRVDVLARLMGVTRGSFYWHFKDRDDLLRSVLQAWRTRATEQVIERFDHQCGDPHALIKELISLPFRGRSAARAARIELAIRGWARRDAMARQAVDEVDARRIEYHVRCFTALGFAPPEAQDRAFALYAYEVAESLLSNQGTADDKARRSALVERLLLAPLQDAAAPPAPAP
jgi:AcrR family transcriptional regulator